MSVIKVENLTFGYPSGEDLIFDNVNIQIDTDWKLGFVGRNGRGKTTFLKLLQGMYEYRGKIISSVKFDYFPYKVEDSSRTTEDVMHEVCPSAEQWEYLRELSLLDVDYDVLSRPFHSLSNGEQTKVLLGAMFLDDGHFLLIDEPTNHLDAQARERVAAYLRKKSGFILVSHDRCFLDGCIDHILALNRANIEVCGGNFSSYMADFEARQNSEQRQNERLRSDIERLQVAARRNAVWADRVESSKIGAVDKGYVGHMSAKMMKRAKVVEKRVQKEIDNKKSLLKNMEMTADLKISPLAYRRDLVASLADVVPIYGGRHICDAVNFEIRLGQRIALDGKNGSGKSSILKLLIGQEIDHEGQIGIGRDVIISYVAQDTSFLRGTLSDLAEQSHIDESLLKAILNKMGFDKRQFDKDIGDFSAGQKKKVLIARSLCTSAHLYVWDEPLNFIDIYSRRQIEDLILRFCPTMIFVEHDRAFRQAIATEEVRLQTKSY